MMSVFTELEHINITPPMALCIIYFVNNMLYILCITNKTDNVQWVRPRARENSLESPICNKSYDVIWTFCKAVPLLYKISVAKKKACSVKYLAKPIGHWELLGLLWSNIFPSSAYNIFKFPYKKYFLACYWALYKLKNDHKTSRDHAAWPNNLVGHLLATKL